MKTWNLMIKIYFHEHGTANHTGRASVTLLKDYFTITRFYETELSTVIEQFSCNCGIHSLE